MSLQAAITQRLTEALAPDYLEVINESHMHAGPQTESHFKVIVVSSAFEGLPLIKRHRQVNEILADLLPQFHALALHTYTSAQWAEKGGAPASPLCQGGH